MKFDFYEIEEFMIDDVEVPQRELKYIALFMDIDKLGIQLDCLFNDRTDMKAQKPIKGGEKITLSIVDRYGKRFRKVFTLTSFDAIVYEGDKDVISRFKGISEKSLELAVQRVATTFNDTPSNIVKLFIPDVEVTPTSNQITVTCPGWTKTKIIEHVSRLAYSDQYKGLFLAWEDFDGYKFKSLNELFKTQTSVNSYITNNRNPYARFNIIEHREVGNTNIVKSSTDNVFQRAYASYDPDAKALVTTKVNADDLTAGKLGKGQMFSKDVKGIQANRPILVGHFDEKTMKSKSENAIGFSEFTKKLHLLLNGDFELNPGTIIQINSGNRYQKTEFDPDIGGLWIVEKVASHFAGDQFYQKVQVTRNASYSYDDRNSSIVNPTIKD